MSYLRIKSNENYKAINLLDRAELYAPGLHCAYYSSLQLLIHFFYVYCPYNEEQAKDEIKNSKIGTHTFYLSKFTEELRGLNESNAAKFYKFFNNLKRKRVEADYYDININSSDLLSAKNKTEKIRAFLNIIHDYGECKNIHTI